MSDRLNKMREEMAQNQKRLKEMEREMKLEERSNLIKPLEDFTTEEKVAFFNKIYKNSLDSLTKKESGEYHEDTQYVWEDCISILGKTKKDFWKYWNSLD